MAKKEEIENEEEKQDLIQVEGTESKVALRTQEGLVALAQSYLRKNGDVVLPPNYDVNDAIKSLYLATLQTVDKTGRPALEVCTKESIKEEMEQIKNLVPDYKIENLKVPGLEDSERNLVIIQK